ncbi:unnamed protein product, partial [Meganyctiphanes norvegica]
MLTTCSSWSLIWMLFLCANGSHLSHIASEYQDGQPDPQVSQNNQEGTGRSLWHKEYHKVESADKPQQQRRPPARGPLREEEHHWEPRPPLNNQLEAWATVAASDDDYYYYYTPTDQDL